MDFPSEPSFITFCQIILKMEYSYQGDILRFSFIQSVHSVLRHKTQQGTSEDVSSGISPFSSPPDQQICTHSKRPPLLIGKSLVRIAMSFSAKWFINP
jgi:hypothetical protein